MTRSERANLRARLQQEIEAEIDAIIADVRERAVEARELATAMGMPIPERLAVLLGESAQTPTPAPAQPPAPAPAAPPSPAVATRVVISAPVMQRYILESLPEDETRDHDELVRRVSVRTGEFDELTARTFDTALKKLRGVGRVRRLEDGTYAKVPPPITGAHPAVGTAERAPIEVKGATPKSPPKPKGAVASTIDPAVLAERVQKIMTRLEQGPATRKELADLFGETRHVGEHTVKYLADAGKIGKNADGLWETGAGRTGWPRELKRMPSARNQSFTAESVRAAKEQLRLLTYVNEHGTAVAPEIEHDLDIPAARANEHLKRLADKKLLRASGKNRHSRYKKRTKAMGRASAEYASLDTATQPTTPETPAPKSGRTELPPPPAAPVESVTGGGEQRNSSDSRPASGVSRQTALNEVRAAIVERAGTVFDLSHIQDDTALDGKEIDHILSTLAASGSIREVRENNQFVGYMYERPTDPGAAAKADARLGRRNGGASGSGATPVAGTGRQRRASGTDVQALLDAVRNKLGKSAVRSTSKGHHAIDLGPGNGQVIVGDKRLDPKDISRLRRFGLPIPASLS